MPTLFTWGALIGACSQAPGPAHEVDGPIGQSSAQFDAGVTAPSPIQTSDSGGVADGAAQGDDRAPDEGTMTVPAVALAYPLELVPGDPDFTFPRAEGRLPNHDSDTWFLAGKLAAEGGKSFAFLAMFIVNRVESVLPADFYSLALYDLDTGEYGTFTEFDMPPANLLSGERKLQAGEGHLALSAKLAHDTAMWTTRTTADGALVPFAYQVHLPGTDQQGREMLLDLSVDATHPPVPVGADTYNGVITCFGQEGTKSYFQTGLRFMGTLHWGTYSGSVHGELGHLDRQTFPQYAGVAAGSDGRDRSHEWLTVFFENGLDISVWQQFDRTLRNAPVPYAGATSFDGRSRLAGYASDIRIEVLSYVKQPDNGVKPYVTPRATIQYYPDSYRMRSASLALDVVATAIVPAPLLALPVEYLDGPTLLTGTLAGKSVRAFGFFERTFGMYRDFELLEVLRVSVDGLPPAAFVDSATDLGTVRARIDALAALIDHDEKDGAKRYIEQAMRPALSALAAPHAAGMLAILADLVATL